MCQTKSGEGSLLFDDALHDVGFDGVLVAICDKVLEILANNFFLRCLDFQTKLSVDLSLLVYFLFGL